MAPAIHGHFVSNPKCTMSEVRCGRGGWIFLYRAANFTRSCRESEPNFSLRYSDARWYQSQCLGSCTPGGGRDQFWIFVVKFFLFFLFSLFQKTTRDEYLHKADIFSDTRHFFPKSSALNFYSSAIESQIISRNELHTHWCWHDVPPCEILETTVGSAPWWPRLLENALQAKRDWLSEVRNDRGQPKLLQRGGSFKCSYQDSGRRAQIVVQPLSGTSVKFTAWRRMNFRMPCSFDTIATFPYSFWFLSVLDTLSTLCSRLFLEP